MSLVDYASSDEDEAEVREQEERDALETKSELLTLDPPLPPPPQTLRPGPSSKSNRQSGFSIELSEPSSMKLPDASFLLNSPVASNLVSGFDHSSRVAAAMAENATRKREANGSGSSSSRSKVPRGTVRPSRSVPDTVGGMLVPPQLSGRSNIVTEDIGKLFVGKHAEPSSQ